MVPGSRICFTSTDSWKSKALLGQLADTNFAFSFARSPRKSYRRGCLPSSYSGSIPSAKDKSKVFEFQESPKAARLHADYGTGDADTCPPATAEENSPGAFIKFPTCLPLTEATQSTQDGAHPHQAGFPEPNPWSRGST